MENPYFEKISWFILRHVDMWWFCPMWPKCAFGDQKGLIRNKDMPFGNPLYHGTKNCRPLEKIDFFIFCLLWVKKWCFGSKKRWFWVFWTGCEVADLNQGQKTIKMNHRNKIQSLVSPTDDPGDAPDCITESGPCTWNMAISAINRPIFQNKGFPLNQCWILSPWCCQNRQKACQPQNMANSEKTAKITKN